MSADPTSTEFAPSRFARVQTAVKMRPVTRSVLYGLGRKHRGLFRKLGKASLVDIPMLDEILAELPLAEFQPLPNSTAR